MTYGTSRPEGPGTGRDRPGWWSTGFVGVGRGWWAALAILVVAGGRRYDDA